jgi:hypothetical protein
MKIKFQHILFSVLFVSPTIVAQKKDNVGTEVVNVVKPYNATVSDAFKVKETPVLDDEETSKREEIQYHIFSFPVASTFTPAKGKAAAVDKSKQEKIFSNYVTLGYGNYASPLAELFVTQNLNRNEYVGGMLRHFSSGGGISNLELDDKFSTTSLDITYGNQQKGKSWNADLGYQNQGYNWYGLPTNFGNDLTVEDRENLIGIIDEKQTYHNFYIAGKIDFEESVFSSMSLKYNRFWDAFSSAENRFFVKPSFIFDIDQFKVKANFIVDYLGGTFERNFYSEESIKYGFVNVGFSPSFSYTQEDLSLNVGVSVFYSMDNENSDNKFLLYPNITASYKLVGDLMVFYAGAEGSLQQNSYRDFTNENPFVSPTLFVAPTDRQYDVFAGLKGKLAGNVSYNIRGSYISEKNKALFLYNSYDVLNANTEGYAFGNSFGVVYDNVKTINFFGELKADFSKSVSFGVNGSFNSFSSDELEEAWNLPVYKFGTSLDVSITPKWYAGVNLFFTGERKDQIRTLSDAEVIPPLYESQTLTLKSYFDANANIGFRYSERLTAFLRANNIANQQYERWLNSPVQGFQILLGASYKFDF